MTEISRTQVHTGTPHIFCHTSTTISRAFVKKQAPGISLEFTVIHTESAIRWFYDLNIRIRQRVSIMKLSRMQVYTGTPHIFCHARTTIPCVFVKKQTPGKSLKFTVIHTESTIKCFYTFKIRQRASIMKLSRTQVYTGTPHICCHTITTIPCVFVKKEAPGKSFEFTFIHRVSTFPWFYDLNIRQHASIMKLSRMQVHTGTPHIFCHASTTIPCVFVKKEAPGKSLKFTVIHKDSTIKYFYVFNIRQRDSIMKISRIQVHTGTPHICCHTITTIPCVFVKKQESGISLKFTFVHRVSTYPWFYDLNFRQRVSMTEISRTQVHTGTPHTFCHTTTVCQGVFLKEIDTRNEVIPDASPHRYPTHILSRHHFLRMCIAEEIGTRNIARIHG
jgi:hypothetical protein